MRVFTVVRHANNPRLFYGGLWSANFYPALRNLGWEIVESQTDLSPTSQFLGKPGGFTPTELATRASATERILAETRAAHQRQPLDLFLSYFYNAHFDPAGFDEIEALGIPSINFYCNSIYQFELVAAIAAKARFSWYPERDAAARYAAAGARGLHVQMGADPLVYRPVYTPRTLDVCFLGQRYADRDRLAAALVRAGVPLSLYGEGWGALEEAPADPCRNAQADTSRNRPGSLSAYLSRARATIAKHGAFGGLGKLFNGWQRSRETRALSVVLAPHVRGRAGDIAETLARHEVVLNFSNVWADGEPGSALIPHVRLRDFEAPMCGACYLTGHTDEIAEFYKIGQEIDTYRSTEELVDKTRFYLQNPAAAESLRKRGATRARHEHTWEKRFTELFHKASLQTPNP